MVEATLGVAVRGVDSILGCADCLFRPVPSFHPAFLISFAISFERGRIRDGVGVEPGAFFLTIRTFSLPSIPITVVLYVC